MKVLIIQKKMIGDVLTSSILAQAVKEMYPEAELHYLIDDNTAAVVDHNPFINRMILLSPRLTSNKWRLFKLIKSIRAERYDIVIDAYCKIATNLISFFSRAGKSISKYKWYSSFMYSKTVKYSEKPKTNAGLAIENRLKLLEPLNIDLTCPIRPRIYLMDSEIEKAKTLMDTAGIDRQKPVYMIGVLGSSENKTYPFNSMAEMLDEIVDQTSAQLLFNYIPKQKEQAHAIYNACNQHTRDHIKLEVFGKSLREFLSLTACCDALIGNEGGAINMAKALDIPTFTIFSPWINKEEWSIFDDGKRHRSVHLIDFHPSLYEGVRSFKSLKPRAAELYNTFEFELFREQLSAFLSEIKPGNKAEV